MISALSLSGKSLSLAIYIYAGFFFFTCCSTETEERVEPDILTLVAVNEIEVKGPSGLALDSAGGFLWTVSDNQGGGIYKMTLNGVITDNLQRYKGNDMEGITMNPNDRTLWIIEERRNEIVQLDLDGRILRFGEIIPRNINENNGLEGISINPENGHIYLLHEKNPRLFIELDQNLQIVREIGINLSAPFNLLDLSGLFYDHKRGEFWIVSDESRRIVVTDLELNPVRFYDLGRVKFEGIAVNSDIRIIYLVNDNENRLYTYSY